MKRIGSDWLSPVVVKELRQGMRGRVFEGSFLVLQGAMIFAIIVGVLAQAATADATFVNGLFWTLTGVLLVVVMPLRGLGAIQNESKAKTLELVFLSRLSAWRITIGKWAALYAQTLLLASAILPYLVLRYFLGGVNILGELMTLGALLAISALLCGVTVGLSATESRLLRAAPVILLIMGFNILPIMFGVSSRGLWGTGSGTSQFWWALLLLGPLVLCYMLQFGAARIAPLAENHATPKRLLVVGMLLAIPLLAYLNTPAKSQATIVTVIALVFTVVACIDSLCEEPRTLSSVYTPFVKRGPLGRLAGWLLYPGWQSGMLFTLLALPAALVLAAIIGTDWADRFNQLLITLLAAIFWPLAIIKLLVPRTTKIGVWYFGIQLSTVILTTFTAVALKIIHTDMKSIVGFFPTSALMLLLVDEGETHWLLQTLFVGLATLVILAVKSRAAWRVTSAGEKQARAELLSKP